MCVPVISSSGYLGLSLCEESLLLHSYKTTTTKTKNLNLDAKEMLVEMRRPISVQRKPLVSDHCSPAVVHTAQPVVTRAKVCAQLLADVTAGRAGALHCWDHSRLPPAPRPGLLSPVPWPFLPFTHSGQQKSHMIEALFIFKTEGSSPVR